MAFKSLEDKKPLESGDPTYAKQQSGVNDTECKILGMQWNKVQDKIGVTTREGEVEATKWGLLKFLASIYDPLGIYFPLHYKVRNYTETPVN